MSFLLNAAIQGFAALAAKGAEKLIMSDVKPASHKPTVIKVDPVKPVIDDRKSFKEMLWQSRENDRIARQQKWKRGRPDPIAAMRWQMGEMQDQMNELRRRNSALAGDNEELNRKINDLENRIED